MIAAERWGVVAAVALGAFSVAPPRMVNAGQSSSPDTSGTTTSKTSADDDAKLQAAMTKFTTAIKSKSVAKLLDCFSRSRPWTLASRGTGSTDLGKRRYSYSQLKKGLTRDGDFYDLFFSDDSELNRQIDQDAKWRRVTGTAFVPPDYAGYDEVANLPELVQWRREGDRYVVDLLVDSGA
jgi:hypothetical protein